MGDLFKGLKFYLEIRLRNEPHEEPFANIITQHGGKVLKAVGKNITHCVWSQGNFKTLLKASEIESVQIVSPLWIEACTKDEKLVSEDEFRPPSLAAKIKAMREELKNKPKKRQVDPMQLSLLEKRAVVPR